MNMVINRDHTVILVVGVNVFLILIVYHQSLLCIIQFFWLAITVSVTISSSISYEFTMFSSPAYKYIITFVLIFI